MGDDATGMGPRTGRPPPAGADVGYAPLDVGLVLTVSSYGHVAPISFLSPTLIVWFLELLGFCIDCCLELDLGAEVV